MVRGVLPSRGDPPSLAGVLPSVLRPILPVPHLSLSPLHPWRVLTLLALLSATAVAQRVPSERTRPDSVRRAARFFGTIVDVATQQPIVGARIASTSFSAVVVTDSSGRFDVPAVPPGLVRFHVTATGFPRASFTLAFAAGEEMERTLELDSASVPAEPGARPLPQMTIEAAPEEPVWLRDFERRRATGRGQYLTREMIESRGGARLSDVVQTMRGVTLDCGGGGGVCRIRMTRAPMQCYPEYFVDGLLNNSWGPLVPIRDMQALEIYSGPSDTPGEFSGRNSGCGTIVIWTRAGPPPPRPR
jgi:hypothetical protein